MDTTNYNSKKFSSERLTRKQKEANDFEWYKEKMKMYNHTSTAQNIGYGGIDAYKGMKVNYDLFNNVVDLSDFAYVCTPFGADVGELPAQMVNRDISSYRIKALLGMELKRPFGYRVLATNKEATTRKEEEETNRIREYVIESVMAPIRKQTEAQYQQQSQGRELSEQEMQQIQEQIEAEIEAKTPDKVRAYMKRDHQDPAEVLGQQLINYLLKKQDVRKKFNNGWKHATLSAHEIYWIGIVNGEPVLKVVNPLRFKCDKSPDLDYIEDGEWARAEFRMHPSEVSQMFDLTEKETDKIWTNMNNSAIRKVEENMFASSTTYEESDNCISVVHFNWKGLREIGWLDYIDEEGQMQTRMLVDETYKMDKEAGDIRVEWEWIPEVYEGYLIDGDIFKGMQPVPGQAKNLDDIYTTKLSYYGAIYDNMNSQPTSIMDRMKVYQYYYNIVMFRLELLLASDDGKKILMNINAVPSEAGIDIEKWQYLFKSTPFMWYNPDEEGMGQQDVNTIAKTLDLSLASDIGRYIELAEYLEQKCGKSVGVTDPVLGQTATSERVGNNQQNLVQTAYMLEPYFDLHASIKRNVLQGLLDLAKVAYSSSDKKVLSYIMDDMSQEMLNLDPELLSESCLGLYMEDSSMSEEIKQTINQLAHAAMQNQKIELSDVLKVIKQDSIQEAEEALLVSEELREKRLQAQQEAEQKAQAEAEAKAREHEKESWAHEADMIVLKEEERRKTVMQQQAILSAGFNEDKDTDNDGQLDILEIARDGVNAKIQMSKEMRENRKLDHQIENDKERNKIEKEKVSKMNQKER
jgi:hypothetical protein